MLSCGFGEAGTGSGQETQPRAVKGPRFISQNKSWNPTVSKVFRECDDCLSKKIFFSPSDRVCTEAACERKLAVRPHVLQQHPQISSADGPHSGGDQARVWGLSDLQHLQPPTNSQVDHKWLSAARKEMFLFGTRQILVKVTAVLSSAQGTVQLRRSMFGIFSSCVAEALAFQMRRKHLTSQFKK